MEQLPDNIKRIDILRVEYGKRKLCQCRIPHYEIDVQNHFVYCTDCGAIVDPFEALLKIAKVCDRLDSEVEELLEQRREIENYKPHLVVMKELERKYRANHFSMVPCCPHCYEPFDLPELAHWVSRKFLEKEKTDEEKLSHDPR